MSFKKILQTELQPTSTSWLDTPIAHPPVKSDTLIAAEEEKKKEIDDKQPWRYPQLNSDFIPKYKHKIPHRLEKAILRYYDVQNWFETIWMVLILNNRWAMTEIYVPEHLQSAVGGTSVIFNENVKESLIEWRVIN